MVLNENLWNLYEHRVHEKFRSLYPNALIEYNAKIKGEMSKRSRQLDSLITYIINVEYKTLHFRTKNYPKIK